MPPLAKMPAAVLAHHAPVPAGFDSYTIMLPRTFRYHVEVELKPGTSLGAYRILAHLTKGGMGSLYIARKDGPGGFERDVVLKVVHQELAIDEEFIRLFLQEARLSAAIRHPNVVHVEDLGQQGRTYYIVMELFDGVSLSRILKRMRKQGQPFPTSVGIYVARCLADGLHAAHETLDRQGQPLEIVHRDATPHNVLVGRAGHVKLIDFGIAKARDATVYTQKGLVRGKIAYLAPEQVWGRGVDRRTDVYALGAVLYEILAGRRLVTASNQAELFAKVREPNHEPLRHHRPDISEELEHVVMRALSESPDARFDTARSMRDALMDACPEAARTGAENLAPIVQAMAEKELTALETVLRTAHAAPPSPPSEAPPGPDDSATDATPITGPFPGSAPLSAHAAEESFPRVPDRAGAAGFPPTRAGGQPAAALAQPTMPIPLVAHDHAAATGPRQRIDSVSGTRPITSNESGTGSGTSRTGDAARPLRFSLEVSRDEAAIHRAARASSKKKRRRWLFVAALLMPFVGAALVIGGVLLYRELSVTDAEGAPTTSGPTLVP